MVLLEIKHGNVLVLRKMVLGPHQPRNRADRHFPPQMADSHVHLSSVRSVRLQADLAILAEPCESR
jgi:hypothetical protein